MTSLRNYLGGETYAGGKLKSTSPLWVSPNYDATNSSGFNALPGGARYFDGTFTLAGTYAYLWTSTQYDVNNAWYFFLDNFDPYFATANHLKQNGFSIRCVRNM